MKACSAARHMLWMARRAIQLGRADGVGGLVSETGQYLRWLFLSTRFVVMTTDTLAYDAGLAVPPVEGLEVHILHSESDMERLAAMGYEDVRDEERRSSLETRCSGVLCLCRERSSPCRLGCTG